MEPIEEIKNLNDKLVELYGKMFKIEYRLDTLDENNVKAQPINQSDSGKSTDQRDVHAGQWPEK